MTPVPFGRRYIRIKKGIQLRVDARSLAVTGLVVAATLILAVAGLMMGSLRLSMTEVLAALSGEGTKLARTIVVEWRLPRVLAAAVFGAGLAVSGAIFQSLTRNPLGSPDIIGLTSGSYTGALVAMLLVGSKSFSGIAGGALIGGLATAALIYALALKKGTQGFRFIIVGVAISTILTSLNSILLLRSKTEVAFTAAAWGAGSLNGITWAQAVPAMLIVGALLLAATTMIRPLRAMELGDDAAKAHGVPVERSRLLLILIAVLLTAAPTAVMGPVSFIALAAPQIALRLTRSGHGFAPAAAMGAFILLSADLAAQRIAPGILLPVGVVTLTIGGLYLVGVLFRQARSAL
ncbi:iron chelate uptake ABC transporter family permease subunit [Paenibacillus albicereus]|uniref:Iron chelate uptake ABC transporter family permease subunit n=1 Tax=Paenibacillus albicereus TaxID=2726185 RepID=A0A6H2GZ51_9BACL|nr:iron chelate uptake ABC transporter family permease subunit [Paenibacillus albicereus]QJC52713.1 iron chelate uptake ABC transporter family permease subunit [Paenibacillus albicereus]